MRTALLFLLIPVAYSVAQSQPAAPNRYILREVSHEPAKLPHLAIFDDLSFRVEGYNVILLGQVTKPIVKSAAEKLVKRVEGVGQVIDQIEVLPLSPMTTKIRQATHLALVRQPPLESYFEQAWCPIRIIVKDGNVTLKGLVSNQADADLARLSARNVPGAFSFTSKLEVAK